MSKNKKKKINRNSAVLALVVLTAVSVGATGVFHTVLKNHQLHLRREVARTEQRIQDYDRDVTNLEIRIGQLEHHRELESTLITSNTQLCEIPLQAIEGIFAVGTVPKVAQTD